jgi:hypothetical protein
LSNGNYRIHRTVLYPKFPGSQLVFDGTVVAVSPSEWSTKLTISGTYDGPTDVVAVRDYQVTWTTDGTTLSEQGTATLVLSSGSTVLSEWSSSVAMTKPDFGRFPTGGETIRVSYSPFQITGNKMTYEWEGTVGLREQSK